jgi:hypothetical protein
MASSNFRFRFFSSKGNTPVARCLTVESRL